MCYKCTQDKGNLCGGYCTPEADDNYQFYWLWDLNDLLLVKEGKMMPYEVMLYDTGKFDTPFQEGGPKGIGGGSFDPSTGNLYLSVQRGDTEQGVYARPPVIVVYKVNGASLVKNEPIEDPDIIIYPNPTSKNLFIKGLVFEAEIRIHDVSGRLITIINTLEETKKINLENVSSSLYIVSVTNKVTKEIYLKKLVKR